jgi:hypothetical protein
MEHRPEWRLEKLRLWQWIMLVASEMSIFVYTTLALLYLDAIVLTFIGFAGERTKDIHLNNLLRRVCTQPEFSSVAECKILGSVLLVFRFVKSRVIWSGRSVIDMCERHAVGFGCSLLLLSSSMF